jgi:thiol-disulfide isomerase/thioredoxin
MKKILIMLVIAQVWSFNTYAQIANGSTAPDFTATDINGVEYNLYELLDEGKTVILDISATWCPPCWSYHTSGALEEVYECYGEPGSDNVVVFMIEGDPSTTMADLQGNTGSTMGDWITGTPYPIIESAQIADDYQIGYWPTIYRICPGDKTVYELGPQSAANAKNAVLNETCTPPVRSDDPALTCSHSGGTGCAGIEAPLAVNLFNGGSNTLTSASIEVMAEGELITTYDWTGSLAVYEEEEVEVGSFVLEETAEITFILTNVTDEKDTNNEAEATMEAALNVESLSLLDTLTVKIRTDNYGNETYWALLNDAGEIMAEGGNTGVGLTNTGVGAGSPPANANAYGNNQTINTEVVVPEGCYNLVVTDYWGDGLCCSYGNGYYKLIDGYGTTLIEGNSFGARADNAFQKSFIVSNEEVLVANNFDVYPNPVNDRLTIEFGLLESTKVNFELVNALGQVIIREDAGSLMTGEHILSLDMVHLQAGIYFVNLHTENGLTTQRIIKQ